MWQAPHLEKKQWKKRSFSPTKVLLSHSLTPSTLIPSPDHNGLTFSKSTSPSFASLFANSLPRLSLIPLLVGVVEEDEGDDKEGDGEGGNEEAEGSVNIYRNMSAGD
nr:hypothetical protein [Tanacetum cinerariifolium]